MDISVKPVTNGWLVVNRTTRDSRVFIDRKEMLDYLDETIPMSGEQAEFVDGLDAEDKPKIEPFKDGERITADRFNEMLRGLNAFTEYQIKAAQVKSQA